MTTRNPRKGGVIASRLRASSKNGNTSSGGAGNALLALEDVCPHARGYGRRS